MSLTGLAFLLLFFGGLFLALVREPKWGLWTYIAVFYLHPPSRWWGVGLPPMRWALLAALVTLIAVVIRNSRDRSNKSANTRPSFFSHSFSVFFALFVVWMWLQAPWVLSPVHFDGVILFTKYLLLVYLIYSILRTPEEIRDTLILHVIGCFYLGWLAYNASGGGRLEGVGGPGIDDSNSLGMQLGTAVAVGAALMLREKWPRMVIVMVAMPLVLNGMIQANSRGAFVGLFCAGIIIWWMKPGAVRGRFVTFASVAVCGFMVMAPITFWERIATLGAVTSEEQELDNSAASRFVIAKAQFRMFADYPLGAGHKGTAELSPTYMDDSVLTSSNTDPNAKRARASHNTYLSVMVDHGIVGVFLLFGIFFWVMRTIRSCRRACNKEPQSTLLLVAVAGGLSVVGLAGMFAPYLKAEVLYWMLALLLCLASLSPSKAVDSLSSNSLPGASKHRRHRNFQGLR